MRNRAFGVEIECGFMQQANTFTAWEEASRIIRAAGRSGTISRYWGEHLGRDGTLLEARSPHLCGVAGFKELACVMDLLRENGGYTTSRDGMHVHHDAPEFVNDVEKTLMLVQSWADNLSVIHQFVAPNRRTSYACSRWPAQEVLALARYKNGEVPDMYAPSRLRDFKNHGWARHDLNISALNEHGTVEIRLHEGCLDPVKAEAWIRFGQALLNSIANGRRKSPLRPVRSREELLKTVRAAKISQEQLA